ncbi:MAG TPA: ribonuclease J [Sphingobacteriaceae bacterium]|nr:ribonuclease J [Sphingobacteriaceae bacterium]
MGGLGEIGKNMTVVAYKDSLLVVDAGLAFPDDEMLGVDVVIPDFTYLLERQEQVAGVLLTHGHEDHVGALPYLLRDLPVPVYGTRFTLGIVKAKLKEYKLELHQDSREIQPGRWFHLGPFRIFPVRVTHSVPDAVGYGIETPAGLVVFTGDYKFDQTPVDGKGPDYDGLVELGRRGVLAMCGDSTNAERPGFTPSEREVGHTITEVFRQAPGRVIMATFASNIHRLQQAIDAAHQFNRRVAVVGRSMEETVAVARELGYLQDRGVIVELQELMKLPPERSVILTTGSQGEPMSALSRMAAAEHRRVELLPGDTVLLAATPVPGNEKLVHRTIDRLFGQGATVIYGSHAGVHVSGHGSREELKLMLNLLRPRYVIPVHGEYRHLIHHAQLAESVGVPRERILIGENGSVFEFSGEEGRIGGRVHAGAVYVDGLGVGDVGNVVLRDRRHLSKDGIVVVVCALKKDTGEILSGPEVLTRGFVYVREAEELLEEVRELVISVVDACRERQVVEWPAIKNKVRDALQDMLYNRTHRRPLILPIILEI